MNRKQVLQTIDEHILIFSTMKEISQDLNRILNENGAVCKKVKDQMEELNKDVEASRKNAPVFKLIYLCR